MSSTTPTVRPSFSLQRRRTTAEPGSWFVNCASYLTKREQPYGPYISQRQCAVSPNSFRPLCISRPFTDLFRHPSAAVRKNREVPLYRRWTLFDLYHTHREPSRTRSHLAGAVQPEPVCGRHRAAGVPKCGLVFGWWYPMPRQLLANMLAIRAHSSPGSRIRLRNPPTAANVSVRCGPLVGADAPWGGWRK